MADEGESGVESKQKNDDSKKRELVSQSIMPAYTFKRSLELAQALCEQFGAKSIEPHLLAQAVNLSPTSTTWRMLSGAAIAYGLTDSGYRAKRISITPLGKSIIMPTEDGEREKAILEAVLKPKILNDFFNRYDKSKLPSKDIGVNVLKSMGIPFDRAEKTFEIVVENGRYAGIITDTKTGPYISISFNDSFIKKGERENNFINPSDSELSSDDEIVESIPNAEIASAQGIRRFSKTRISGSSCSINLNIQLQLPETTNPEVYDKLFESMKKHLIE